MMKTWMMHRNLALLGLLAVAACDQVGTGLFNDDLTPDEVLELTVLEDEGSFDIPVEITTVGTDVAASFGASRVSEGRSLTADAQRHFAAAREALRAGDRPRALEEAREARRLIARAVLATGGQEALDALIERIEEISLTADDDDDVFDDPRDIADELKTLADAARDLLARGDSVGAGERAILGEQRARYRRGRRDHRGDINPDRARLAVGLAGTSVSLAERLIANQDVPPRDNATDVADRQNRWLMHANRMLERAEQALANGRFARAVHFAQHAHWSALKAVILPGGITEEELDAMVVVADNLYAEAEAELRDDSSELELRLFERAGRLIELGKSKLEEGNKRGVAPLWRASVICAWLLP
ncbi:MAG: HEPN domain-containing protein [Gemmatimonadota bacterium]|nr:HEPN domain-containing protein [Gemmatimonadota bacterium]MDH3422606.1 HEPN domain-containing protein [Gemmatimonadota bacterium]